MKQTELFTRTVKELPKDESSYNAQSLIRGGFVDKTTAGVYTFLPLGLRVLNKIRAIICEEMEALGGQEISMPALAPRENWQATGRWDEMDVLFKLGAADEKAYALNPTHEEIVTPLAKKFILSYKDLPFATYQIQTKFRNEKRAKAGIMRGREFLMKDLYSFHTNQEDLDVYYDKVLDSYHKIFSRVGLGHITYLTYASGGSFSKYSHEFQTESEAGEDLIYLCEKCRLAVNKEIIADQDSCPKCGNKELVEKKAIEVGNIFKLGTKYSSAFNLNYKDNEGKDQPVIMGCYGIGLSRIMGTVVETSHDERGIIWPESIAPYKIHLISLSVNEEAEKIYQDLRGAGFEVLYDNRDVSAGEKFADSDLIGCPYRLIVSNKTLKENSVEFKKRNSSEAELVLISEIKNKLK